MNTPSPLVPQGTSPDRGKSGLYFKILMVLTVHVVFIGGMLLQGCKDTKTGANELAAGTEPTNADINTLPPVNTNYQPPTTPATNSYAGSSPMPSGTNPMTSATTSTPPVAQPLPPVAPESRDYVIARGDTLALVAKRNSISLKTLMAANPGVDPRKLKIGAKLQLPAAESTPAMSGGGNNASSGIMDSGDTALYTVKAGDMLGRIAKAHGTTVAKIKALNDLKSSSIRAGQKLKLPGAKAATEPSTATSAPSNPAFYAAATPPTGATR